MRGDGSVRYDGRAHVRIPGSAHVEGRSGRGARPRARDAGRGLLRAEGRYSALVTDLPTTYTSLTIGSRTKKVKNYFKAPEKLHDLENRIDAVSDAKRYVFITGAAIREMQKTGWRATGADAAEWMTRAIYAGDADVVGALLAAGYKANAADENGVTLLMRRRSGLLGAGPAADCGRRRQDAAGPRRPQRRRPRARRPGVRPAAPVRGDPQAADRRGRGECGIGVIW